MSLIRILFHGRVLHPGVGVLAVAVVVAGAPVSAAGPDVGELLALCDRAAVSGFQGRDGAACEWYAVPCACKLSDPASGAEPWCVPESESIEATRDRVLAALRASADPRRPVQEAVASILTRLYPCPREESGP